MNLKNYYYVKIHNSPRSRILPKELNLKIIDFVFNLTLKSSIGLLPYRFINKNEKFIPIDSKILIEYDGNLFLNIWLIFFLFRKKNKIVLDCHNSAIENQKGHFLRFIINRFYLIFLNKFLNIEIILHNKYISPKFIKYSIIETPYPKFNFKDKTIKNIDVLFLCSLNDDEPVGLIVQLCKKLRSLGLTSKITGNYNKVKNNYKSDFFIIPYPSYNQYINYIRRSKKTVCLTSRSKTLLFSPREAISLNVECFINDSKVNRSFYGNKVKYLNILDFKRTLNLLTK